MGNSDICKKNWRAVLQLLAVLDRSSQSGCTGTCQSVSRSEASPEANGPLVVADLGHHLFSSH